MHPGARRARPTYGQPAGVGLSRFRLSEKRREMIPRLLIPFDARPSALEPTARRRPSTLDDRTLVPSGLAVTPLDAISQIPANLPLEAIPKRFIVPRDLNPEAYQVREEEHPLPPQPSEMDERITVPLGAASPEII